MNVWRGALLFLTGLALGAVIAVIGPRYVDPYLPEALRGKVELVEGEVTGKQREADRLLITVVTPRGAILATFKKRIPEVDLLVAEGDGLTLGLRRVEPFVEDPAIESVRKKAPAEREAKRMSAGAGLVLGIRWLMTQAGAPRGDRALEILRERHARGEINREGFEARRRDLV